MNGTLILENTNVEKDINKKNYSILMAEAYGSIPQMVRYYGESENGTVVRYGSQIPFNFALMGLSQSSKAGDFINNIKVWINAMPNGVGIHANWVVSTFSFN